MAAYRHQLRGSLRVATPRQNRATSCVLRRRRLANTRPLDRQPRRQATTATASAAPSSMTPPVHAGCCRLQCCRHRKPAMAPPRAPIAPIIAGTALGARTDRATINAPPAPVAIRLARPGHSSRLGQFGSWSHTISPSIPATAPIRTWLDRSLLRLSKRMGTPTPKLARAPAALPISSARVATSSDRLHGMMTTSQSLDEVDRGCGAFCQPPSSEWSVGYRVAALGWRRRQLNPTRSALRRRGPVSCSAPCLPCDLFHAP